MARVRVKGKLLSPEKTAARKQRIHQKAVGRHTAYLNDPNAFGPGAGLSPLQLEKDTKAAVGLKYGQAETQANQQLSAIPSYFDDYLQKLRESQARQAAFNAGVQQGIEGLATQDTAGGSASPEAQAALKARQALVNSQAGTVGAQTTAQNSYMEAQQNIAGRQKIQTTLDKQTALQGLKKEEGDYANQYKADAITRAKTYGLSAGALGLNTEKAKTDAANKKATIKLNTKKVKLDQMDKDRQYQLDVQKFGQTQAKDNYQKAHGLGPYKPASSKGGGGSGGSFTPTQIRKAKRDYRSALSWAQSHHPTAGDYSQLVDALLASPTQRKGTQLHDPKTGKPLYNPDGTPKTTGGTGGGFGIDDPLLAKAIAQSAIYGGVDEKTRRRVVKNYGVYLRVRKVPKQRVGAAPRNKGERPT